MQKYIAMVFIDPKYSEVGTALEINILGEKFSAEVCEACLYDPENSLVRN